MINPEHEKAKRNALNYKKKLAELNIKEKIVKLPPGYGATKIELENAKKGIKPDLLQQRYQGKNAVSPINISRAGRLHEQGLTYSEVAEKMMVSYTKGRYWIKLYIKEKKENADRIAERNIPE